MCRAARATHRRAVERCRSAANPSLFFDDEQDAGRERRCLRLALTRSNWHHLSPRDGRTVLWVFQDLTFTTNITGRCSCSIRRHRITEGEREGVRPVRSGSVDARRPDDEPGPALRLLRARYPTFLPSTRWVPLERNFRRPSWSAGKTCHRASAVPTTCSATGGLRSRRASATTSRAVPQRSESARQ